MAAPGGAVSRILRQPAAGHPVGIVALQQFRPVPEIAGIFQCSTDRFPCVGIPAASRLLGGQLQTPAQVQVPPMGTALAAPVAPLIQPRHGWSQAVRGWGICGGQQLRDPLIREAVAADPSVAVRQGSDPVMGLGGVIRLLGETTEGSLGIPLAPHVLNHHQISLACPPAGVGQGHC